MTLYQGTVVPGVSFVPILFVRFMDRMLTRSRPKESLSFRNLMFASLLYCWHWGSFAAMFELVGMRASTTESKAMVPCRETVGCPLAVRLTHGKLEREMDRWFGVAPVVLQMLCPTAIMKRRLSWKVKLSTYQSIHIPTLSCGPHVNILIFIW